MTPEDWMGVIGQIAKLGATMVQFIGGEPTLHDALPELVNHALGLAMRVEVFSNLVHISDTLWDVLTLPGVSVATSWYSDDPSEHERITNRRSWERTRSNVIQVRARGIPLRTGIIGVLPSQRTDAAHQLLAELGVTDIGHDDIRLVGRPAGLLTTYGDVKKHSHPGAHVYQNVQSAVWSGL